MSKNSGSYYTHIDGLRALAVFTVVLFHINHSYLPGGFVGVDIFFVISGFLISGQIFKEVSTQTFSLKRFYERRIKRILPAALSVILITLFIAQILFLPEDAIKVAESGIWSSVSLSNVYFWKFQDTGYFAAGSYTTPLLHYWSLGVEEQFYIFWPLIVLVLLPRVSKAQFISLLIITVAISATISQVLLAEHHSFVYYMLPTRAGELLVGAILAALLHYKLIKRPSKNTVWFPVSLLGLIISCWFISPSMVFPGWLYLLPTVSAALFIWSGFNQSSTFYTLITRKPVLWLGKVSYSAYLAHWPILAFYRYGYGEPSVAVASILFVVILFAAWLNWRFVEEKFRYVDFSLPKLIVLQAIVPTLVVMVFASMVIKTQGLGIRSFSNQYNDNLVSSTNRAISSNKYDYICQYWRLENAHFDNSKCVIGNPSSVDVLLWGDSNAAHYIGILGSLALAQNWSFRNVSHAACPPIFYDVKPYVSVSRYDDCTRSIALVKTKLSAYKTLVISAAFDNYSRKDDKFMDYFESTVNTLVNMGTVVIIIGKAPVFSHFDRHCLAKALVYPLLNCFNAQSTNEAQITSINQRLENYAAATSNVEYLDFNEWLCDDTCSPYKNGKPIYYDAGHIEIGASWNLGKKIAENAPTNLKINYL